MASLPVVLGKIYMGTQNTVTTANCALIGDSLVVSNSASLPASTEFTGNIPANYNSVLKIYDKIKTLEQHTQATVSSAKSMAIKKKLTPIKDANGSVLYWQYQLRISLVGFTDDDIGKKIVLLRTTKHSCKENASAAGYKHPANYDNSYFNAKTTGKIQRLGYGNIAGKRVPLSTSAETFDAVPSWMPHNGFAETE